MSAAKRQSARAGVIFALALVVLGALVGLLTVALSVAVDGGASLFAERPQLVWLLPVAGLCSYGAYRAVGLDFSWSTARVMEAVRDGRSVPPLLAPAIIVGTALTVLCGGSVGKEAAALQMGAAASGLLRDRVSARFRTVLAPAAMGAALGAMLDAPLAGVVFSFEALRRRPGSLASLAAPAVTSLVSWSVVRAMGVRFLPGSVAAPAVLDVVLAGDSFMGDRVVGALLLLAAVGAAAGLLALAFCGALGKLRGGLARLGPSLRWRSGEWPRRSSSAMRIFSTMRTCARTAVRAFCRLRRLWRGRLCLGGPSS